MRTYSSGVVLLVLILAPFRIQSSETGTRPPQLAEIQKAGFEKKIPGVPTFTSLYTDMKRSCRLLPEPKGADSGGDPAGVCKGYGGYRIFISHSAWSAQFSVEKIKNKGESVELGSDYSSYGAHGEKVEWRLANGVPFAVIMRLGKYKERDDGENPYTDANRIGSTLVVKGLKRWEHIDFTVDGAAADANAKARELADQNYSKKQKVGAASTL